MRHLFFVIIALFLFACGQKEEAKTEHRHNDHEMKESASAGMAEEKVIYYTCPMAEHKHIHSAQPGQCPECGMELVAGVITSEDKMEYYGCPMLIHSHVRSDSAGTCAECGMELKPMRLIKKKKESM